MTKEFVPYELALELKQLGFDEPCFAIYYNPSKELFIGGTINPFTKEIRTLAPTYSQAFRWFREKYDLFISIFHYENGYAINDLRRFDTHEEAEVACLTSLIELAEARI